MSPAAKAAATQTKAASAAFREPAKAGLGRVAAGSPAGDTSRRRRTVRPFHRQKEGEARTLPLLALHPDSALVGLDRHATEGQAQPRATALLLALLDHLPKALEDRLLVFLRDALALIDHIRSEERRV